jgi:hypothetical protein
MAKLVLRKDKRFWYLEVDNFSEFRSIIGDEVLASFCRCFVHADRLTSLVHFIRLTGEHCDQGSVAATRNLHTMVWFAAGTLREYAKAIQKLRASLARAGLLEPDTEQWQKLREIEDRWHQQAYYRDFRNRVAFHVDYDNIVDGLDALGEVGEAVTVCLGDNSQEGQESHWYRVGIESLIRGLGMPLEEFEPLFQQIAEDLSVNEHLFDVFRRAVQQKGIRVD